MRVLAKLSEYSGIQYRGSDKHVWSIVRHLRSDVTEWDLRAIARLKGDEWRNDPRMRQYLRPETLYGPETIERYLDAARTEFAAELAELHHQPSLEVVR